ncbi:S8 family serine peptidase [Lysinibacillus fusiformis]
MFSHNGWSWCPPPGTHGYDWGNDRSRLSFSNYGTCLDAQGWGSGVTTTGYGDLSKKRNIQNRDYTDFFAGTSSATPLVAGAIACAQGTLIARGKEPMYPALLRYFLTNSGTNQQDESGRPSAQRIGNLPDIKQIIELANENDP